MKELITDIVHYIKINKTTVLDYLGVITWFVIIVAAKIGHISKSKKLTRSEVIMNVLYSIVGGVMAYFGMYNYSMNIKVIAIGVGAITGDTIFGFFINKSGSLLETVYNGLTDLITSYFKKKK